MSAVPMGRVSLGERVRSPARTKVAHSDTVLPHSAIDRDAVSSGKRGGSPNPTLAEEAGVADDEAGAMAQAASDAVDPNDVVPREQYEAVCRRLLSLETDLAIIASVAGPHSVEAGGVDGAVVST